MIASTPCVWPGNSGNRNIITVRPRLCDRNYTCAASILNAHNDTTVVGQLGQFFDRNILERVEFTYECTKCGFVTASQHKLSITSHKSSLTATLGNCHCNKVVAKIAGHRPYYNPNHPA